MIRGAPGVSFDPMRVFAIEMMVVVWLTVFCMKDMIDTSRSAISRPLHQSKRLVRKILRLVPKWKAGPSAPVNDGSRVSRSKE